ncbi:MAG: hypothetical protein KFH87_01925 [Bacteroidetes bacterium]|nr:hypothetical protein [Bacteroidota bacterium]
MTLTIDTDNDIRSTDNARQMQPMMECRRCSRAVGVLRKSAGRKFVHCTRVTQYFKFAAVGAVFGAVDLRGTAGDTLHVPLDHPPVREGVMQDMLVCDTNTTTFANPVYSLIAVLSARYNQVNVECEMKNRTSLFRDVKPRSTIS